MKIRHQVIATLASAFALTAIAPAFAHEGRILPANVKKIRLSVGFAAEPAWEDSYNGVDVILNTYDAACTQTPRGYYGNPIDTGGTEGKPDPDTVDLNVEALYLKAALPPTGPYGNIPPAGILKRLVLTTKSPLKPKFGTPGTYNTYFRPTTPGFYGFHVWGTVHAGPNTSTKCPGDPANVPLAARSARFNVYFICSEKGSFTPPSAFNCIESQQTFPGAPAAAYSPYGPVPYSAADQ